MDRKKYYIELKEQEFEVSRELYEAYMKGYRKERYFTHDLKKERRRVDEKTGEVRIIPSREDSYERLFEVEKRFIAEVESVEDAAIRAVDNFIPVIREHSGRQEQHGSCRDNPHKAGGERKAQAGTAAYGAGLTAMRAGRDNDTSAEMQLSVGGTEP